VVVPGFVLRVSATGHRSYSVVYGGRADKARFTVGAVGRLSLSRARKRAREILARAQLGQDPQAEKLAERQKAAAGTLRMLSESFFKAKPRKRGGQWRPSTEAVYRVAWDNYILPRFGNADPDAIKPQDVRLFLDGIARKVPIMANRVLEAFRRCYTWALPRGLRQLHAVRGDRQALAVAPRHPHLHQRRDPRHLRGGHCKVAALVGKEAHGFPLGSLGLGRRGQHDVLVGDRICGVRQRRADVLCGEVWIGIEQVGLRGALAQLAQNQVDGNPRTPNHRFGAGRGRGPCITPASIVIRPRVVMALITSNSLILSPERRMALAGHRCRPSPSAAPPSGAFLGPFDSQRSSSSRALVSVVRRRVEVNRGGLAQLVQDLGPALGADFLKLRVQLVLADPERLLASGPVHRQRPACERSTARPGQRRVKPGAPRERPRCSLSGSPARSCGTRRGSRP
jgi:hypothetical protein